MPQNRAKFIHARIKKEKTTSLSEVDLSYEDRIFMGKSAPTPNENINEVRLVSGATLEALELLIGKKSVFTLKFARVMHVADTHIVMVEILLEDSGRKIELLGVSHVVNGDLTSASARATLDAANRFLDLYLSR